MPDPATALLNRYHTLEFFMDVKRVLRSPGVLVTSVTGSLNYVGREMGGYVATVHGTLREVFPEVLLIPGDRVMLFASTSAGVFTVDPEILAERKASKGVRDDHFPPEAFAFWIQENQVRLWRHALEAHERTVNRDDRPAAYLRFLTLWDLVTERRLEPSLMRHLTDLPFSWVLGLCAALLGVGLLAGAPSKPGRMSLMVVAVTGFTGMAQEILCLYMYQALRGYLYSRLGMVVALFMAGLALGGWLASRASPSAPRSILRLLLGVQGLLVVMCAGIPLGWVPSFFGQGGHAVTETLLEAAVGAWMILAGLGTGATFSLACGLMGGGESSVGRTAGAINASDHLGAALGALLPGTILVPVLGLAQTGVFLCVLQGCALLLALLNFLDLGRRGGVGSPS
jgi:spermidine synthase